MTLRYAAFLAFSCNVFLGLGCVDDASSVPTTAASDAAITSDAAPDDTLAHDSTTTHDTTTHDTTTHDTTTHDTTTHDTNETAVEVTPGTANVVIDTAARHQTWQFWSTLSRRWDAPHMYYGPARGPAVDRVPEADREAILDALYTDLALDAIEVPLVGGDMDPSVENGGSAWKSHEQVNDNADPNVLASENLDFSYWPAHLDIVKGAFARIRARGIEPVLGLRVGNVPAWLGALHGDAQYPEFAEWVTSLILYFRDTHGLETTYVSINNEPEGNGLGPDVMAARAKALRDRLSALGLTTRLTGPETVTPGNAASMGYLAAFEANGVADDLWMVSYHAYDEDASVGALPPLADRQALKAFAAKHGAGTFFSEQSTDVKQNRRTFWNDTPEQALAWANDLVREMTVTDMAAYCQMWNLWSNNNPNFGTDGFVTLKVGPAPEYAYQGYFKPAFTDVLGRFMAVIRRGMVRVDVTTSAPDVVLVAFVDDARQTLAVVAVNNGSTAQELRLPGGVSGVVAAGDVLALTAALP